MSFVPAKSTLDTVCAFDIDVVFRVRVCQIFSEHFYQNIWSDQPLIFFCLSCQDRRYYLADEPLLRQPILKPTVAKLSVHLLWPMVLIVNSFHRYSSLWRFFSVKPSATCSPPQEFFEHWAHFSSDFLLFWRKEQQAVAKQIYEETKRKVYKEKVEGLAVKPATSTGLKLKLASSKKSNANWSH